MTKLSHKHIREEKMSLHANLLITRTENSFMLDVSVRNTFQQKWSMIACKLKRAHHHIPITETLKKMVTANSKICKQVANMFHNQIDE